MNGLLAVVAWVAALNPARTRLGLPERDGRARMELVAPGVWLGVAFLVAVAALSESLLDVLEITPEMFRIAAGFVLVIVAAWMIFEPIPAEEPVARGLLGAVWPVAYPHVISPETLTLAISTGASDGVQLGPMALAGAALILLGAGRFGFTGRRVTATVGRITAVALIVVAIWLAIQGVREV
jgi:small neutral amino acid transporter SnatA (MarC family)